MKTKTLLLSVTVLSAGLLSAVAQTNFSENVVGYAKRQLYANPNDATAPTFAFVANNFEIADSTISNVLFSLPINSRVLRWNPATANFSTFTRSTLPGAGGWTPAGSGTNVTLGLGEAVLVKLNAGSTSNFTNLFAGDVFQSTDGVCFTNVLVPGLNAVSYPVPINISANSAGLSNAVPTSPPGGRIQKWNEITQAGYTTFTRNLLPAGWSPAVPTVNIGEGFFVFNPTATNRLWITCYTVPN